MTRRIELLGGHDVRRFRSGVSALDAYLRSAKGNTERGIGRTYVLLRGDDDPTEWPELLGYYTLSMGELPSEVARRMTGERLPGYPMPVALIGRLANDERVRGAGIGGAILGEAIRTVLEASNLIACFGIVVDAKNEGVLAFYTKYGFTPVTPEGSFPRRCFLDLRTARSALSDEPTGDDAP